MHAPAADNRLGLGHGTLWPVVLAAAVRLGVWSVLPHTRFASDEDSYYAVASALLATGQQDLFWPPVTGWLIAGAAWLLQTTDIRWIRLVWIGMDVGCTLAVAILAGRLAAATFPSDPVRARRFAVAAPLAYALYLPAISFSQFATSEMPALLFVLGALVLLTRPARSGRDVAAAGLAIGAACITRPSLLPLLVSLPAALPLASRGRAHAVGRDAFQPRAGMAAWRPVSVHAALTFILAGALVIAAVIARNAWISGEPTIAQNSAYNLYIGNRDLYAEDLDLFHPVATAGQIEFRRQYWSGELPYPTESPEELQRAALGWIADNPGVFARRALGRLARVFAPKTDVLELLGGERAAGIFSPASLTLLAIANLQWVVVLFGGLVGLAALWRLQPVPGTVFVATVLGSLPLCLIAISKPRYAFPFEPVLLVGAVLLLVAPRLVARSLQGRDRWLLAACAAFLLWGWTAWLIFAVTSRVALATVS